MNDAVLCNALSITHVYTLFVQKRAMQVLSKTNEDIIKEYFDAMQTEINPSVNYVNTNRNTLNRLLEFHNNKFFLKMNKEDIISYLNSLRKSEDIDPLHKWIGTYNSRIIGDCALYPLIVTSTDIGG